jgi:hypothetical protein
MKKALWEISVTGLWRVFIKASGLDSPYVVGWLDAWRAGAGWMSSIQTSRREKYLGGNWLRQ